MSSKTLASKNEILEGPFTLITTPKFETGNTDPFTKAATDMALVHNCIMRAFNGIYHNAVRIQPSDYKAFVSYSYTLWECLREHHSGEEKFAFPEIERITGQKDLMAVNVAQHEAFHSGLDEMAEYLLGLMKGDPSQFSGKHLQNIIDKFSEPLRQHLHDEIPTILGLSIYADKLDIASVMKEEAEKAMGGMSKVRGLPAFMLNNDVDFEGGIHDFPPIPLPVRWFLSHICTLWHWNWWKFSTCDSNGHLRA